MSGSKKHLAGGGDAAATLSKEKVKELKENSQKNNLAPNDYFLGVDRNPLLTIFAVELNECRKSESVEQEEKIKEQYLKDYVIGFGIGIPSLSDQKTKYAKYVVNKIFIQRIFEDEMELGEDDD